MKRYLCSHWALNPSDEAFVKSMGFAGLRFDIPWGAPKEYIRQAFDTMAKLRLEALAVIGGWARWESGQPVAAAHFAPPLSAIGVEARKTARILLKSDMPSDLVSWEMGNEPDQSEWDSPREFTEFVRRGADGIWDIIPAATVVVGGVSNINRNRSGGARYFDAICAAGVHSTMVLGIHPYRGDRRPHEAPRGWKSIDDVFQWLKSKERRIWITECGWHTASQVRKSFWGICQKNVQWSDKEVAEIVEAEMKLWEDAGIERYCYYQMNDGFSEDNYGVRDVNMDPKPIARMFQRVWGVT